MAIQITDILMFYSSDGRRRLALSDPKRALYDSLPVKLKLYMSKIDWINFYNIIGTSFSKELEWEKHPLKQWADKKVGRK